MYTKHEHYTNEEAATIKLKFPIIWIWMIVMCLVWQTQNWEITKIVDSLVISF